jgi:uncharacterized protein YdaU (DUF1376 family)
MHSNTTQKSKKSKSHWFRKQDCNAELTISTSMSDIAALAYHRLMMRYRLNGGPLKDDDGILARGAGLSTRAWKKARPEVAEWFVINDGLWIHEKENADIAKAKEKSKNNTRAINQRWEKRKRDTNVHTNVSENGYVRNTSKSVISKQS